MELFECVVCFFLCVVHTLSLQLVGLLQVQLFIVRFKEALIGGQALPWSAEAKVLPRRLKGLDEGSI